MVKLKRLTIQKFRQVRPGTTLDFADGLNLILGKNGTGKTHLLELLGAVWSGDFSAFADDPEGVDIVAEFENGESRAQVAIQMGWREELPPADMGLRPPVRTWNFQCAASTLLDGVCEEVVIAASQDDNHVGLIERRRGGVLLTREDDPHSPWWQYVEHVDLFFAYPFNPFSGLGGGVYTNSEFIIHLAWHDSQIYGSYGLSSAPKPVSKVTPPSFPLPTGGHVKGAFLRFDEALVWWGDTRASAALAGALIKQSESINFHIGSAFLPGELERVARDQLNRDQDNSSQSLTVDVMRFGGSDSALLRAASATLGVQDIVVRFSKDSQRPARGRESQGTVEFKYIIDRIQVLRKDGFEFELRSKEASFGQQRMVAFLWYLGIFSEVVICDELANGLHHEWIATAIEAIGERQAFLATQHPFLIDYLPGLADAEAVRRSFVLCSASTEEGPEYWDWRQMSEDEAEDVFQALQVGIMHVNEILMTRGLW